MATNVRCVLGRCRELARIALVAVPMAARAQSVQGLLLRADSVPAGGVIVAASRVETDSVVARTITSGNGRYLINVPVGKVQLRALRVGHKPVVIGEFTLAAGERRDEHFVLPDAPIELQAVTTETSTSCRTTGTSGAKVATVFEEARKALLSTQLRSVEGAPTVRLSLYRQVRPGGNGAVAPPRHEFQQGPSLTPFESLPPDSLAKVGYMRSDVMGWTFWAPDADVLLSETFASSHCLSLAADTVRRAGWIGLAFRPANVRRNFVDVSGTLWLDRATSELRRMDYRYEGLPLPMGRVEAGGEMEFTRLSDGMWFVNKWEIRMPRMAVLPGTRRPAGVSVRGGMVWRMSRGEDLLYSNGLKEPKAVANATRPSEGPEVVAEAPSTDTVCTPRAESAGGGLLSGAVHDERGAPLADAIVVAEWQGEYGTSMRGLTWETRTLTSLTGPDGTFAACGIPDDRLLKVTATFGAHSSRTVAVRVGEGERRVIVEMRIVGASADSAGNAEVDPDPSKQMPSPRAQPTIAPSAFVIQGVAFDSIAGRPLVGTTVEVASTPPQHAPRSVVTDSAGRYRFDGLVAGQYTVGFFTETLAALGLDDVTRNVTLAVDSVTDVDLAIPSSASVRAIRCGDIQTYSTGMLVGTVRDAERKATITGAKLTLKWTALALDAGTYRVVTEQATATIEGDGTFVVCHLPVDAALDLTVLAPGHRDVNGPVVTIPGNGIARLDVLLVDSGATSGPAMLRGRVVRESGKAVTSGRVVVPALGRDVPVQDGTFVVAGMPVGTWVAESRVIGVEPQAMVVTVTTDAIRPVTFTVSDHPQKLDVVSVIGKPSPQLRLLDEVLRRKRIGMGTTFLPGSPALQTATWVADVMKEARGFRFRSPTDIRGRLDCKPVAVFVDGLRIPDGFANVDAFVRPNEVLAIETWPDILLAPVQYRVAALGCALVLIWTKRAF